MTADTGALRIIPGSHREPFLSQIQAYLDAHRRELEIDDLPAVPCETVPGDIVAFNYPAFHASAGGSNDRRMCTIEFLEYPHARDQADRMLDCISDIIIRTNKSHRRVDYPWFHPDWIANPQRSTVRQGMIDRMRDLGIFELEGAMI
jgi:ectoine hydroxylase-related dioxygenase (phytanoyl-CoA dioxygenase family)